MSKLEIIAWLLFASFGGVGGLRSDLSLFIMAGNVDNMKWLGFGATNLSHATKLTGSKLAKKSDNTQLFYIMCYVALIL